MSVIESYTKEERRINGVFYTPLFLAEYLAKKVLQYSGSNKISSIFDPACGDSMLLRVLSSKLASEQTKKLPKIVGIDNDINAIISSSSQFSQKPYAKFVTQFIHTDGLFPTPGKNSVDGWHSVLQEVKLPGFDIALSNPPWGSDLSTYNSVLLNNNFQLAKGQFDIYNLFVEVILKNLNKQGTYGLILPDSVFTQEQAKFRALLSTSTKIHLIARLGEKIFPEINRACVIIIGENSTPLPGHQVDCFRLSSDFKKKVISKQISLEEVENNLLHKVPQTRFSQNNNFTFDIDLKTEELGTFDKIEKNSRTLKCLVNNTRGAEISKKGIVCQCSNCSHWMPFPRSKNPRCNNCNSNISIESAIQEKIVLNHNGFGNIKLKVGEDLYRYTSISKSWINTLKKGINYKNLNIYNGEKILVRKTGVGITASLDYENSITNQVVYILKLKSEFKSKLSLEFILAVLNSRVMTYYLIKKYGENEWKTHPYLTQSMLINLPFPDIDFSSNDAKKSILEVTEKIREEISKSNEKNISRENDIFLERTIANFFNLNKADYKVIFKSLSSSEQLIPIKRLLDVSVNDIFR